MVIDPVIARRLELAIAILECRVKRLVEQVELEFARAKARQTSLLQASQLRGQHRAGRLGDQLAVVMPVIADHERGRRLPGQHAQRGQVGSHLEIAEAGVPVGDLETVERVHVEVHGEQVVAAVRALGQRGLEKVRRREALAHEPPERIGKGDNDGVDLAGFDRGFQFSNLHSSFLEVYDSPLVCLCDDRSRWASLNRLIVS